ncbi:MAG TPA: NADH-ubiquinone oxidoreductase-F iron-sulfur binding region domain-containing protein [Caldisericia bacterium]|nr:NADH-ubiquinone oxidoreductase-F iron-sulfur binding region domain-containing protein [Caldisericia bacterium]HOU08600.1 NADH-ubiquinone oxidoreductase-F iron-sulfur binding region domain-containing protein [Caldisericia bacterium]HQG60020.1 NADH-ubiquinone oxidoreductase-F iron-sulfur binding region domain-containing protein [Caldisericia bacterium]HQH49698.1 NADH-ubiquinone oxidoreductase-F iron-sulfur binding region domain-containing protein [Caldisericia bacterium]HQJ44843.1 NADH-ubiquin
MQTATDFALTKENLGAYLTGSLSGDSAKGIEAMLSKLKREDVSKPTIYVGTGTCGLGAGAGKTLEAIKVYLAEKNVDADIIQVGCIGLCAEEPMVDFQLPGRTRISFRKITEDKVPKLMDAMLAGNVPEDLACFQFRSKTLKGWNNVKYMDEHPFFASQTRWVLAGCGIVDPTNIWEYIASDGYKAFAKAIYDKTRQEVCDMVEKSGLRGRGGGGFNTGTKWKLALQQEADQKYMICNADEGDPGAFMDRAVIEGDPHRMIEGLAIAAYAIGASKAYVYLRAEYPLAIKHLQQALKQAKEIGLLGENILDSGFDLEIKIKMGAGAFVCGEETALIHSIEGKRGMPRPRPPYPSVKGLFGKPTAINNVETLANVPTLVRNGEGWFSSIGTATSKGTKVFALSGNVNNTGLVEVAMGTNLRKIIFEIGGGIPKGRQFKSVQIGGPSGGCMPTPLLDTEIDYESLKSAGAMMGSGGMVVMDDATCMVDVAKYFMDFIQRESCGKCIPCREGTRRMLEILTMITKGRKGEHGADALERFQGITQLERLAEVIKDTSLCGLGNTSPNPILSTLRWFKPEYEAHIYERRCPAGVCPELLVYSIDADKCTGCTLCAKNCPAASIMGAPKSPHYIITDKCISCGTCFTVCRFGAVSKS